MWEANSRRSFLQNSFSYALRLAFILTSIESCTVKDKGTAKKNSTGTSADPCSDYSELGKDEIKKRESLGYVRKSPSADKYCGNCNLWLPPVAGIACGKCQLFKGPVPAEAYCTYWAPRV